MVVVILAFDYSVIDGGNRSAAHTMGPAAAQPPHRPRRPGALAVLVISISADLDYSFAKFR